MEKDEYDWLRLGWDAVRFSKSQEQDEMKIGLLGHVFVSGTSETMQ